MKKSEASDPGTNTGCAAPGGGRMRCIIGRRDGESREEREEEENHLWDEDGALWSRHAQRRLQPRCKLQNEEKNGNKSRIMLLFVLPGSHDVHRPSVLPSSSKKSL